MAADFAALRGGGETGVFFASSGGGGGGGGSGWEEVTYVEQECEGRPQANAANAEAAAEQW